ncbi:helix-turn-helix domain-containing protein (plasmid) [Streptomyces sp. NBC_00053]|uniref:helix-turn-helix domain-containing protein n=1 Tax=unclassified Streptomyces TaxID=2593676 RepID=UPI00225277C8|nr:MULTISPECIES: helix-turn-helix transcriptional regulator [unclassified Streptomyces]MCX4399930.1 helix-turn-helix domain-containing protein [Streptomyces sp. NBC_01767]MCX5506066.1 helix-turn-helix domain-containing protein [Streptomyces sp. NBC_00052]MCX5554279.1 helix-turn-helix domain-containing protein [Streptomyces sp. NBC_00051]WSP52969.1 helix-turn-helix domain-containing protein [Streptomyces sp. NBC_01243]
MGTIIDPAPGEHVAMLRKARGWTQTQLSDRANVSTSLLSKVEVGDRALTPEVAAALGRAFGMSMAEVLGRASVAADDEHLLAELRSAMRDYDMPSPLAVPEDRVAASLRAADRFRDGVDVAALITLLPDLLRCATTYAHTANSPTAWSALADVYSTVYWLAARHRWMDMAELAVTRQRWAVEQRPNPVAEAFSSRDRAGTYLNFGDVERGLVVVDRAIVAVQSAPLSTADRDLAVGILNLRGMTLAGRLQDKSEGKREAQRHIESAWRAAGSFSMGDVDAHGLTFGPQNTFTHVLATQVDLGRPHDALALTDDLDEALGGLPPTRVAPTRINAARAQLDLGDRDGALENLSRAFDVAPQMARIHPMGREVLRVLVSLHRRANPELKRLSRLSGIRL